MGRKRALLVGINYIDDPENKLRGCWNDVERMGECLISRYAFPKEAICTLVDRPGTSPRSMPTGEVIREKLSDLTRDLQWGDCILFHFSGHGVQLPPEGEPDETGMKEAIVPADFNMITDDDFRVLVDKIPDGVTFTFIADCCHSGGLIAHSEQQVGSVHTKPVSLLCSLGPQPQEDESEEEEEGEPVVVSEEVMIEILASMLGSVSTQDPSVTLLEILAMMEAANSANQDLSLLDLLALYVASQQQNVSMSDILESMLAEQEIASGQQNSAQKAFATFTRSVQRDKQLKKERIQQMLGSTKAHDVTRLLDISRHARRSLSTRGFNGAPYNASYGGHQHYALQDQNRIGFSHNNREPIIPHQQYAYPPPNIAVSCHNDANAPWQYPPLLKHTVSDPGAYAYSHSHAGAPDPHEPNPFGAHPSMQRWGSDLGGGGGYGMASHGRYSGGAMQGGLAQFQPPWAANPAVDNASGSRHNHEPGFRGDVHGRQEFVQPGAWSYGSQATNGGNKYAMKRSMPVQAVTRMLSDRSGRKVEAGNIRANLYDLFGDKSSITCKAVVATILDELTTKGGSSSGSRGILKRISSKSIDFLSSKLRDPKTKIDKYLRSTMSASGVSATTLHHIPKRPDRCVLITACQSDEVASEHMEVIHGAFTKVILDIVEEHKASLLDNHRLVYESRHRLAKKPYKQHPCLYSTPQQAHNVFISY